MGMDNVTISSHVVNGMHKVPRIEHPANSSCLVDIIRMHTKYRSVDTHYPIDEDKDYKGCRTV